MALPIHSDNGKNILTITLDTSMPEASLTPDALKGATEKILSEGIEQNHSKDYMTDQLFKLFQQNPEVAQGLKFPKNFQEIKKRLVMPFDQFTKLEDVNADPFEVDYKDYFKDQSHAKLPATGHTTILNYEGMRDNPAFGAYTYVVDADGNIVEGELRSNTFPINPKTQATVPEGMHDFIQGKHQGKIEAIRMGSYDEKGKFERKTELGQEHPDPSLNRTYATVINMHPGSGNENNVRNRGSEGCQTVNANDWPRFWEAYQKADRHPNNRSKDKGYVGVIRR